MSIKNNIVESAQEHVFKLLKEGGQKELVYHNYNHTLEVVKAVEQIGEGSPEISKEDLELLKLAAWFHDTGYVKAYKGHEDFSIQYANDFLVQHELPEHEIVKITDAIKATELPQSPKNLFEEILCDADFSHLGKKGYLNKADLLRLEWRLMGVTPSDDNWPLSDLNFLVEHSFYSEFAQNEYGNRKNKNIITLQNIHDDLIAGRLKKKKKEEVPEKGIETMFRVIFRNHMHLSSIADNKANIMLSINAIIISISLSTLIPKFDDNPGLIFPTIFLLFVSILTMVFATLSTMPKIESGIFTREEVVQKKNNLLFFGNFHAMPLQEFEWGISELMKKKKYLYSALIKDFYSLGTVLAKKYKYLRICYHVFIYGIILSVLVFLIVFLTN